MAARTQAWLERREEELDVWEASLVDKQRELDTVVRQFREEMATSLAQLASQRRDLQSFAQSLATREEQLSRAEESLLAREDRLMADASRLAALIVNDSDDGDAALTPTRQRHNNIPSERSGDRPVTSAGRPSSHEHSGHRQHQHVDPTLSATEEVTTIDLATLVVRGSVVMTSDGHILSPLESAEVLVQCGAFEASEIEALMRQGYSATAILAEQLGTDDGARPGTPDRPRTRAVGAPADRSSGGQRVAQHHHGFDDSEDEGAYEEDNVVEGMEGVEEGEYDDGEFEYIEEEEEEEEEEEHNISLK